MSDINKLRDLIDQYWDIAWREGSDGRDHDTGEGSAQKCRSAIEAELTTAQAEIESLRGQIAQSEQRRQKSILSARNQWLSHGDALHQKVSEENEALRGRVAELDEECRNALAYMLILSGGDEQMPSVKKMIFRKQAEAVEAAANENAPGVCGPIDDPSPECIAVRETIADIRDYAQRLRQQADEAEKAGGGE